MEQKYQTGDFVACYVTNAEVYEELLVWGMVIDISPTLEDILILDKDGKTSWWPAHRWRPLNLDREISPIIGTLA